MELKKTTEQVYRQIIKEIPKQTASEFLLKLEQKLLKLDKK